MTEPLLTNEEKEAARRFMNEALQEARKAEGRTRPNPCVGVIIVKNGRVVGRGFHERAGAPHAEVMALRAAGELAKGADLYSTLEPCDHTGRTPPCTRALIQAGIARVFVGCTDINPKVSGKGIQRLRGSGIRVYTDILAKDCQALNAPFFKFVTTHRPFVTLKVAATADGKIATGTGHSQWITCPESRELVHRWRDQVDAVLVGANTLRLDDPLLTARPGGVRQKRQPWRIILSRSMDIPPAARLFSDVTPQAPVLVVTPSFSAAASETASVLRSKGVQVEAAEPASGDDSCLDAMLRLLADRDIMHLMVEGGAALLGQFIREGLFDRLQLFVAPKILGSGLSWAGFDGPDRMALAKPLQSENVRRVGDDFLLTYSRPPAVPTNVQ